MNSNSVKWALIGMGALLCALIIGVFAFNYFTKPVSTNDTVSAIKVSNMDGTNVFGYVYVKNEKLVSTVSNASVFTNFFNANKTDWEKTELDYLGSLMQEDGSVVLEDRTTDVTLDSYIYGVQSELVKDADIAGAYNLDVVDITVSGNQITEI